MKRYEFQHIPKFEFHNHTLYAILLCQANEKNVRISAMEDNDLKVFLISGSPKDAEKIYTAVEYR